METNRNGFLLNGYVSGVAFSFATTERREGDVLKQCCHFFMSSFLQNRVIIRVRLEFSISFKVTIAINLKVGHMHYVNWKNQNVTPFFLSSGDHRRNVSRQKYGDDADCYKPFLISLRHIHAYNNACHCINRLLLSRLVILKRK